MQKMERPGRASRARRGFTLVEMMVVITIVLILFGVALQFRPNDQVAKESSRRLGAAIMAAFDLPKLDALTGRAVDVGTSAAPDFVNPSFIRVAVATGSVQTFYMSGTLGGTGTDAVSLGAGKPLQWPFFGDQAYKIVARGAMLADGSRVALADTGTLVMDLAGTKAAFTGSDASLSGAVGIQVVAEYKGWRTLVEFDARSGRVGTYFDRYPGCLSPDVRLSNGQVWAACNVQRGGKGCGANGCGAGPELRNYFQWGWSDGSYVTNRAYAGGEPENRGTWGTGAQGPCAIGYHVPTHAEWVSAFAAAGGMTANLAVLLNLARADQVNACASNDDAAACGSALTNGWYWSSTATNATQAVLVHNVWTSPSVAGWNKNVGFSVRCIRN